MHRSGHGSALLTGALISCAALSSAGVTAAETARDTAGQPPRATELSIPIPLFFGRVELGQPAAQLAESGQLLGFPGSEIIELLRPIVVPETIAALEALRTADGFLAVSRLAEVGLSAEYNPRELVLRLLIPLELRTATAVSIAARRPPLENVRLAPPADVSAYVNLRAAADYLSRDGGGQDRGRQPAVVDFDGAVEVSGAAIEATATYRERSADPWRRGDVRLVKDFPGDRNRLTLGDLNYATTGFQSFQQAGGIAFARNFNLQPYRVAASTGERTFTLARRSEVDVLVNGHWVRTVALDPGRYNLRDLPLASGANDVALRITDEVGRVETIRFPFVFDTSLLAKGEQDFSYAFGERSRSTSRSKIYEGNGPVFSAYHALGVADHLTLGGNLQVIERHRVVGAEARVGTLFGIFRGDLAASESSYAPPGMSGRLQYRWTEPAAPGSLSRNLLANLVYRGRSFLPLGATEPANPIAFDAGVSYGQKLPADDWLGSIGYSVQFDRNRSPASRSIGVALSRRVSDTVFLDVFARRERPPERETESSVLLTLTWVPVQSRQRMSVRRDSRERTTRVDWSYFPADIVGGVQASASAERSPVEERVRSELSYVDYRFEARLRDNETFGGEATSPRRDTGVRFGTALVYADGHAAVSRPIADSFAMVVPHPTLGRDVQVNTMNGKPQAQSDFLGAAVLPRLPSYYVQRVHVDVPDAPPGYDLGDQVFNVQPRYRSGTVITVGTGATALIEGSVVDAEGNPIELRLGTVVSVDAPGRVPKQFFTDAQGRFQLVGLVPGRYELRLDAAPDVFIPFEVPAGAAGTHALGRLVLQTVQDE